MRYLFLVVLCGCFLGSLRGQDDISAKYRRSSLYTLLITHPQEKFGQDIEEVFVGMPTPDKFDNHDLSIKTFRSDEKHKSQKSEEGNGWPLLGSFLENNAVARRMVARWFNRDKETGGFDMELVASRGHYNASELDVKLAKENVRGTSLLADAGEELIGSTFVMINDIRYVDKEERAKMWGAILQGAGTVAGAAAGGALGNSISQLGGNAKLLADQIAGFRVIVTSYLYRLEWNDTVAGTFYNDYYTSLPSIDQQKVMAFPRDSGTFRLKYVGYQVVNSGKTSMNGMAAANDDLLKSQMIRKVCTRALDEAIVQLQKENEEFKIRVPLTKVDPEIAASIGLKEGITAQSKFEVLEQREDENGRTAYKRVGVIKPAGKIWDNRYMATEEKADGADLKETRFKKVSGGNFYPGMLIREIKF